jgi:hypothetical protein
MEPGTSRKRSRSVIYSTATSVVTVTLHRGAICGTVCVMLCSAVRMTGGDSVLGAVVKFTLLIFERCVLWEGLQKTRPFFPVHCRQYRRWGGEVCSSGHGGERGCLQVLRTVVRANLCVRRPLELKGKGVRGVPMSTMSLDYILHKDGCLLGCLRHGVW